MKVLIVSPSFYPATIYGGPIYSTYNLAKVLSEQNIKVYVSTTNANGNKRLDVKSNRFIRKYNNLKIKYYGLSNNRGFSIMMFFFLWFDILKSDKVYLISVFSPPTPYTILFALLFKKPLIISPRGQLDEWCLEQGNKFKKIWLKLFISPIHRKILWHVTSKIEEKMLKSIYPDSKTAVIPNGINLDNYSDPDTTKDQSVYKEITGKNLEGKSIIVSMGRLHKVKGFDILIDAIHLLTKDNNDIVLLIAGTDFGEKLNLENQIKNLGLENSVFLVGYIEGKQKKQFLHNADIFVLASHHENFGMVAVEAMACGCAVIISDKVGIYDLVNEYKAGIICKTESKDLEQKLKILLDEESLGKELSGNAYKLLRDKFDINKVADQMIEQYKRISAFNNA